MSLTEISLNIPTEHVANVFGQFDAYIKKIERTLNVTVVVRGDSMKLIGNERQIKSASNVFMQLLELSKRGNVITEQNVNYALSLAAEAKESAIVEIDKDCICHTINGKPVKPKTLGQKNYVDAIRQKMIVFGMGPAGTGKTYLAMAMAITAFKNEEVGRIILTRPAIEAGEKLGFLPGDLQSKVDPYLRPLYDALYQIMGAESFQKNMEKGLIEVAPLAYMRGRTLDNAFIILDEAQNTTPAHHTGNDRNPNCNKKNQSYIHDPLCHKLFLHLSFLPLFLLLCRFLFIAIFIIFVCFYNFLYDRVAHNVLAGQFTDTDLVYLF